MSHKRYPLRVPRVAAGIRAQETRSLSTRCWWHVRWVETLEAMGLGGRLGRGKNYALSGQVTRLEFERGSGGPGRPFSRVLADVVGARPDPYRVSADFRTPTGEARARIVARLRAEPMLVARLLVNDLPTEVEEIFRDEGFSLFPGGKLAPRTYDVTTACSCPDYANPCKHSAAVLLILGEEIARRPATLVELRGIELRELYDED